MYPNIYTKSPEKRHHGDCGRFQMPLCVVTVTKYIHASQYPFSPCSHIRFYFVFFIKSIGQLIEYPKSVIEISFDTFISRIYFMKSTISTFIVTEITFYSLIYRIYNFRMFFVQFSSPCCNPSIPCNSSCIRSSHIFTMIPATFIVEGISGVSVLKKPISFFR